MHLFSRTLTLRLLPRLAACLTAGTLLAMPLAARAEAEKGKPTAATATVRGAGEKKDEISGTVKFTAAEDGVHVVAEIKGLTAGKHGFHIHQKPDLSAPDLTSAGPHFNPTNAKHGGPHTDVHHAGDLGNLVADEKGVAHYDEVIKGLTLAGETNGVIGHSVIVHAKEDEMTPADPKGSGNSGPRIAGGVIEAGSGEEAKPASK